MDVKTHISITFPVFFMLQKQRDARGGGGDEEREFHTVDSKPMMRNKAAGGKRSLLFILCLYLSTFICLFSFELNKYLMQMGRTSRDAHHGAGVAAYTPGIPEIISFLAKFKAFFKTAQYKISRDIH